MRENRPNLWHEREIVAVRNGTTWSTQKSAQAKGYPIRDSHSPTSKNKDYSLPRYSVTTLS